MKQIIAVLLITTLCACVTTPSENKAFSKSTGNKWVGHTIDELIIANGEPSDIYKIEGGCRVFEYLNLKNATTGVQPSSSRPSLSGTDPRAQHVRAKRKKSASGQSQGCKTLFNVSASDIVESWSTEGKNCN